MGISDMKDMFSQLRQAQKQVKQIQKELGNIQWNRKRGGLVKATVDGEATLVDLQIDESMLQGDELKVLPKLIKNAVRMLKRKLELKQLPKCSLWPVAWAFRECKCCQSLNLWFTKLVSSGIGRRSAARIAFHILSSPEESVKQRRFAYLF